MTKVIAILFILLFPVTMVARKTAYTLKKRNITLAQALKIIEDKSGYSVAYNKSDMDPAKKIEIDLENAELEDLLSAILNPAGFTYQLVGNHIVIKPLSEKTGDTAFLHQTIRGVVTDKASGVPVSFATIFVVDSNPAIGAISDSTGQFRLENLVVGRYALRVSCVGYEPAIINEIQLNSAKESYCEISLKELTMNLEEVVIRPLVKKDQPLNPMVLTGARMVSVEEANRYAGGFDDPARLVSSFAGVAGNVGSNAIAVRGNSPQFFQWKLEGVEIPNPTHFADMTGIGGGILTALSSQVMGNSDFFTGAFPSEYNNALSGVFDMHMRKGNNQKYEHTFQVGLMGIDVASEGPVNKKKRSSYLFNYRYSTMALMNAIAGQTAMNYQDLSFKLNFPTRSAGTFSVWGIGLLDKNRAKAESDSAKWVSSVDKQKVHTDMVKAAGGVGHLYYLGKDTYVKTSLATTYSRNRQDIQTLDKQLAFYKVGDLVSHNRDITLFSYINRKFSSSHLNRTGLTLTGLFYNTNFNLSPEEYKPMEKIAEGSGFTSALSAFSNSIIRLNKKFTANIGVTGQYFMLNKRWSLEPRFSLKWQLLPRHSLSLAYGLHSRRERLDYYYVKTKESGDTLVNKNLKLAKSHHLVFSYNWNISPAIHLKVEPYFQYLFHIPVEPGSSFSVINHNAYVMDRRLVNTGKGRNYGIDLTLEQYMVRGWFWLVSGSLFKSEYYGGDARWRRSRLDQTFLLNALAGKEWIWGKQRQHVINASIRLSCQGGQRYAPIDREKTYEKKTVYFDETRANTLRTPNSFITDLTFNYKLNKKNVAHEIGLKVLNLNGFKDLGLQYNYKSRKIEYLREALVVPNLAYKIYF